jgi:hypothetical protein
MKLRIRGSDIRLATPFVSACWLVPSHILGDTYQSAVSHVPDWVLPFSIGVALTAYVLDPFNKHSRLRQLWRWWTDIFEITNLHAQTNWQDWNGPGDYMPETDLGVRVLLRFRRDARISLRVRVFSCTGMANPNVPYEDLIKWGEMTVARGEVFKMALVDMGIAEPGWDPERPRGWGPNREVRFIAGAGSIAVIECKHGWLTQRHKIFVQMISHVGKHSAPRLYVQDEEDDIFDTSRNAVTGDSRRGH